MAHQAAYPIARAAASGVSPIVPSAADVAAASESKQKHERLIGALREGGVIKSDRVRYAMANVDRALFVPDAEHAHEDKPQRFAQFNANVSGAL
jgi:hypothetical protein